MRHQANSNWQIVVGSCETKILRQSLALTWRTIKAMFREIFDESAYDRFLFRTGKTRSVASYREFLKETETALARKPRCC
jgi:hypothetical protein